MYQAISRLIMFWIVDRSCQSLSESKRSVSGNSFGGVNWRSWSVIPRNSASKGLMVSSASEDGSF